MPIVNQDYFDNFNGTIFVQPDGPNTISYPLLCSDIDGIDEPQGDVTTRFCRDGSGNWVTVNRSQGTPGAVTGDVVSWESRTRAWLEKMRQERCPFPVYIHKMHCGREDTFLNYTVGKLLANSFVTNKSSGQNVRRRADEGENAEKTEQTFSLSAQPNSEEYYKLVGSVTSTGDDEGLNDIITCTTPQCLGPCGAAEGACQYLQAVADSAASPTTANTYYSNDYAATWSTGGTDPFPGGVNIASAVCVKIDATTERLIVVNGSARPAAGVLGINYSDDGGATWAGIVDVGATAGEFAIHSGALFALDARHIWLCTDQAAVYFSSDAGLTWTAQSTPTPAASESLYYVHFVDDSYGWAVGGFRTTPTGHFIQTTDGGAHWAMAAAEPKVELGIWVSVIDNNRVWVGLDDGTVYYSLDWGATWTARTFTTTPTNTGDGRFIDEHAGFIGGYTTSGGNYYPWMARTFDGGYEWEIYTHGTSFSVAPLYGLNAIQVCGYNKVHAVGEQLTGGHCIVWTLKPAGATWD